MRRPQKPKRRWHLFIALSGERISERNPWEWIAAFRDRQDAKTFGYLYTTKAGPLAGSRREPVGWKFKISSNPKP